MKQYLVLGRDGKDENALDRRMQQRPLHFETARSLKAKDRFIKGGAMLDEEGKMIGSAMMVQFESEEELHAWLENEPYISGKVWESYEVIPFRVADV